MIVLSKKNIIFVSLLLSVLGVILGKISDNGSCGQLDICILAAYPLLFFVPVFAFSLIAACFKEEVFSSWRKLTNWWAAIALFLIALSPAQQAALIGFNRKDTLFFLACLYSVASLILVVYKSYKLRGK